MWSEALAVYKRVDQAMWRQSLIELVVSLVSV